VRHSVVSNCVLLNSGQRSSGLLQQICDRLRDGQQTAGDLEKLTCQRRNFPNFRTDYTLHYDNESCSFTNLRQRWSECSEASPTIRMSICKASCHTTNNNDSVVDGLAALPPKKFNFAADALCVSIGCDVRLVKNMDVAAGFVNSATGTVVNVIYDNADCEALQCCQGHETTMRETYPLHSDPFPPFFLLPRLPLLSRLPLFPSPVPFSYKFSLSPALVLFTLSFLYKWNP